MDENVGALQFSYLAIQADNVTLLHKSKSSERLWAIVHSDLGPYLVCAWYRPPEPGGTDSIATLAKEYEELSPGMLGTIIFGGMDVHQKRWLWKSSRNSGESEALHKFCLGKGLQQLVREATREQYMLDLVLSGVETLKCKVLPKNADHSLVHAHFNLPVPKTNVRERLVWKYVNADWEGLRDALEHARWNRMSQTSADASAYFFTTEVLQAAHFSFQGRPFTIGSLLTHG